MARKVSATRRTRVKALNAAIECVLLDNADQLGGINADANLAELAYCYWQLTGWINLGSKPGDAQDRISAENLAFGYPDRGAAENGL
jgi:hypothetical protein